MTSTNGIGLSNFKHIRDSLAGVLLELADLAEQRKETVIDSFTHNAQLASDPHNFRRPLADMLRDRAESVKRKAAFRLAVVGEFKAGKSTLINALLNREIISTGRRPTTASLTSLRYGEPERFRVTYLPTYAKDNPTFTQETSDLLRELAPYISDPAVDNEAGTALVSGEQKSLSETIREVEVWCTADFLRDREIDIIDTPGLGSVFPGHRAVTFSIVPEVDATIFMFSTEDGVGQGEIDFLRYVREYVNRVFFVMSKADYALGKQELDEQLVFNTDVIAERAQIKDITIYPISSRRAIEGKLDTSGFPEMLSALDEFLVRAGGAARLELPIYFGRFHLNRLKSSIEAEIGLSNQQLESIIKLKSGLEGEKQRIEARKADLLRYVEDSIRDIMLDASDGIENLPTRIQMQVEKQLEQYDIRKLVRADKLLPEVIKGVAEQWLREREQRFRSKALRLQQRIETDLAAILETIQRVSSVSLRSHADASSVPMPIAGLFVPSALRFMGGMALRSGFSLAAGFGMVGLAYGVLGIPVLTVGMVLLPFLFPLRQVFADSLKFGKQVRDSIKEGLKKPIPGNRQNVYEAVIEGFLDPKTGTEHDGLLRIMTSSLSQWSKQLTDTITGNINDNIDQASRRLQTRVEQEESGRWDRHQQLARLNTQKEALETLDRRLLEIETLVKQLVEEKHDE